MKPETHLYQEPIAGSAWISRLELGAGIYLLEGRTHFAGHRSPAERTLLDRGALLIASVRFDRDPVRAPHPRGPIRPIPPRAVLTFCCDQSLS